MNLNMNIKEKREAGFTLLELLIVVSIIAILSVALVLVLDPAETLKKSRDAQRMSDMSTIKTALGLYLTSTSTPYLGSSTSTANCKANIAGATTRIMYSLPSTTSISDPSLDAASGVVALQSATPSLTDGTGWVPVNLDSLTSGSPISNFPIDPVNNVAVGASTAANVTSEALVYRYACMLSPLTFEIDAQLESTAYTSTEDKRKSDGGNSDLYYEVGTNLKIVDGDTNAL